MTRKAVFFVSVAGQDITASLTNIVTSIDVTDASGKSSDTANISIADDGSIVLPSEGDPIVIGMGWTVPVVLFDGIIDNVRSKGNRGSGKTLSISAKSADTVKGKAKQQREKHKDKGKLGDVAKEWGKEAGLEVVVHEEIAAIERDYWSMNNESYMGWAERTARDVGATFKIMGTRGVWVPRSAGLSASGAPLAEIVIRAGDNLLDWDIKPSVGRPQHKKIRTKYFDPMTAEWEYEEEEADYDTQSEATMTTRYSEPTKDHAKRRSKSKNKENKRDKGGGTISMLGDPAAQSEANARLIGARHGVDGTYRVDSVTHSLTRSGSYECALSVKQPSGKAGIDDR